MPDRDTTRINERIRVPEVRLIDENGEQVGILPTDQALRMAQDRDLDLVEVAAQSRPPVCRILDYSKYKYEQAQKQKAARKHQTTIVLREIKFRPKIAQHDYDTKKGHVERFLLHKDKVKITIMFRGREVTHPERGQMILERLAEELEEIAQVDQRPQQDGRNMTMMLSPSKAVLAGQIDAESWKTRGDGSALMEVEDEGITVEGPGEERSERVVAEPKPDRRKKAKAEAEADADTADEAKPEPKAKRAPEPAEAPEPVAEPEPEVVPEPEPEPVAEEPEPEPEAEAPKEEPKPEPVKKPKKAGPAPVSKAEAAAKRKPKPLMNLGTGARVPGINAEEEDESEDGKDGKAKDAKAKKPAARKKPPTKAEAAAAVAAAKKPGARKPAAAKASAKSEDDAES